MKKILTLTLALLGMCAFNVQAEKADATKQTVINFDSIQRDEISLTTVISGNVEIRKGTLLLKSDKAVIKETPEGDMFVTLTAAGAKPATFRQKRDGGPDLWVEGQAQRIEYDDRVSMVKLFTNAQIRQLEGARTTDELQAQFISYDSLREQFEGLNDSSGVSKPGQGRNTMIIAPRKPRAAPAATPATPAPGTR